MTDCVVHSRIMMTCRKSRVRPYKDESAISYNDDKVLVVMSHSDVDD